MLIGLVSDPHANIHALEAVLRDVERVQPDILVCLGDFVGYGAFPNEVISALRDKCGVSLAGNHDLCTIGSSRFPIENMNEVAAAAVRWTSGVLSAESRRFVEKLESRGRIDEVDLMHASPRDPVSEYVLDAVTAFNNFVDEADFTIAVVGHTHVPAMYVLIDGAVDGGRIASTDDQVSIEIPRRRVILNPGGVGQPRDGDPRASWALLDPASRRFTVRRVEYPISKAQQGILSAGLPGFLAERLSVGM